MKKIVKRSVLAFLLLLLLLIAYIGYLVYVGGKVSEGEKIAVYPKTKTALLIIDIQEGTTGKNSAYPAYLGQSEELIQIVNKLVAASEKSGVSIVYVKQETENPVVKYLTNNVLAKDTPSAAIDERINIVSNHIFSKQVQDAFSNPELDEFLIANQINRLIITGLDIDGCAGATIEAAFNRGYEILVVEDAVISQSDEPKRKKIAEFKQAGLQILRSESVINMLGE